MNKNKKSNKSGYPDEAIRTLARCFYPSMVEFFNSEEGQREYEEWLKEQETLNWERPGFFATITDETASKEKKQ